MTRTAPALAALAAVGVVAAAYGSGAAPRLAGSVRPPATAQVTRATLVRTERLTGTLGYGDPATLTARPAGAPVTPAVPGTLTWLPRVGAVVRPGQPVYRVDDRPVVLLVGELPLYRPLARGVSGADVRLLEENLAAFGYTGFTVDRAYTAATATAVRRWQKDLGVPQTGTVDVDQVAVAPGDLRVTELKTAPGAGAAGPVLGYTGTTRAVTGALDVTRRHLVRPGLAASVTLPDGRTVPGEVTGVGTVASPAGAVGVTAATVDVTVSVADQSALGGLDAAPVGLTLIAERRDVLTVPVGALVTLAGGGYGVLVVEGRSTRYVAVRAGVSAGGRVEVSGDGIAEGVTVGVRPRRRR